MKPILNLAILLLLGYIPDLRAQVNVESLTVADGLSQGFVTSIIQDEKGFIWIGTFDGLNRYDGYTVRHFKPKPFDSLSLQCSYITALYEDHQHLIWVGTADGVFVFDPLKERFFHATGKGSSLPANFVNNITGDNQHNIYIQIRLETTPIGIYRIHLPADFSKTVFDDKNPNANIRVDQVSVSGTVHGKLFMMDCVGDSMILARDSLQTFRYLDAGHQFQVFDLRQLRGGETIDHNILWGKNTGFIFRRKLPDGTDSILPNNRWLLALKMRNGRIGAWIYPKGPLVVANRKDTPISANLDFPKNLLLEQSDFQKEFTTLTFDEAWLSDMSYWNDKIIADRGGVIWLATGGWGIRKINPHQISFGKFLTGESISLLRELPDGRIWVRLYNDETFVLNPASGDIEPAPWESAFGKQDFYQLFVTKDHNYWMVEPKSSPVHGLMMYEEKTGQVTRFTEPLPFIEGAPEKIMEDQQGNIWVGAHNGTVYRCRPGQKNLDRFSYAFLLSTDDSHNLRTTAITQDAHGTIWIGTNRGVVRVTDVDGMQPKFLLLRHDIKNQQSLSIDWVTTICLDLKDQDVLWLGTRGGGLNRLNTATQRFSFWTEASNGMPDNVVYGILPDTLGNLWCSTNRGICRFSPDNNTFISYLETDGLSSTEFNTNAYLRTRDGRFWFGGVSGLNVFRPEEMLPQTTAPTVAITEIRVRGVERFPDKENFLSLSFEENNVLFEFSTLDFANMATNRFRHRLKGIDEDWVYDGTVHNVNYSALPPGKYVLELEGATADSPWCDQPVKFTLIIGSPWYRTSLAFFVYFLIALFAIFGYTRYQKKVITLQNTATLNQRESKRLKEFEALKNQFFANVAHEFRTPLTVILGLAERLRKGIKGDSIAENARLIIKQGDQLLHLTNQVLELARLENNQFQLHVQQGDIIAFIKSHIDALVPLAASKGIHMNTDFDTPELQMDFDPYKLQKILNNLISNALRHTPPGGNISVSTIVQGNKEWLNIRVSDTGEGILSEDLPRVFDRFFQGSKPNNFVGASGIGLTLTRDVVQLMGGRVTVESTVGTGTTFSIILPIANKMPPMDVTPANAFVPEIKLPAPVETNPTKKPLLLVIEDNSDVLAYLRLCLQSHFRLAIASNGETGIEKGLELIPDIILTDVAMPLKNGYEVAATLKNDLRTSHIPIVMLTAKVEPQDRMEGHLRGANAYLTKPFDASELLLVLQNLLELQQKWKDRYQHFFQDQKNLAATNHSPEDVQVEDKFMQKLDEIFTSHYMEDAFNLDQLCRILNMSSSQLDRKIKALSNQSPMLMLRTYRLKKAQTLLRNEPMISIKEVCFRTGFKNPSHFSRLYSKEFGSPPSEG